MEEQSGCAMLIALVFIGAVAAFAAYAHGYSSGHDDGHKAGQVDALNGKWKWVKVADADGHEYVVEKH